MVCFEQIASKAWHISFEMIRLLRKTILTEFSEETEAVSRLE